jgi:HlyD family secretion protein
VVKEGQQVRPGDVLATLWSDLQSEGVNQAQAALEAALTQRDSANDNLKRVKSLAEAGAAPQAQLDAALTGARAAEAAVRQATAAVATASAQKERTLVRSPIRGVVTQIALREGDLAGMARPSRPAPPDKRKAVLRSRARLLPVKEGHRALDRAAGGKSREGKVTAKPGGGR